MARCIITGCALYLQHTSSVAWGDLHLSGNQFIFHANCEVNDADQGRNASMNVRWHTRSEATEQFGERLRRSVSIPVGRDYFVARGVLVFRADMNALSDAARAYIGQSVCDEIARSNTVGA